MITNKALDKGFALIILAVLIAILGLVLIGRVPAQPEKDKVVFVRTQAKLDAIHASLLNYYNLNSSTLPCPANPTYATSNASFGLAAATGSTCSGTGSCPAGLVCAAADPNGAGNSTANQIKIGGVPTKTLGLPDDYAFDEWGNRITFAVDPTASENIGVYWINRTGTSALVQYSNTVNPCYTSASAYTPSTAIATKNSHCLTDDTLNPTSTPIGQLPTYGTHKGVAAFVVAHGKDGSAIWNRNGSNISANCVAGTLKNPSSTTMDSSVSEQQNCNKTAVGSVASFVMDTLGDKLLNSKSTYYDDLTTYFVANNSCPVNTSTFGMMIGTEVTSGATYGKGYQVFKLCQDGSISTVENYNDSTNAAGNLWLTNGTGSTTYMQRASCLELSNGNPFCVVYGWSVNVGTYWVISPVTGAKLASAGTNYTGSSCQFTPINSTVDPAVAGYTAYTSGISGNNSTNQLNCSESVAVPGKIGCNLQFGGTSSGYVGDFEIDANNLPVACPLTYDYNTISKGLASGDGNRPISCAFFPGSADKACFRTYSASEVYLMERHHTVYNDMNETGTGTGAFNPYLPNPASNNTEKLDANHGMYGGANNDLPHHTVAADCHSLNSVAYPDDVLCMVTYEEQYIAGTGGGYHPAGNQYRATLNAIVVAKDNYPAEQNGCSATQISSHHNSLCSVPTTVSNCAGSTGCTAPVSSNPAPNDLTTTPSPNVNWTTYFNSSAAGTRDAYLPYTITGIDPTVAQPAGSSATYIPTYNNIFCRPYTSNGITSKNKYVCIVLYSTGANPGLFIVDATLAPVKITAGPICSGISSTNNLIWDCSKVYTKNTPNNFYCYMSLTTQPIGITTPEVISHSYQMLNIAADGSSCAVTSRGTQTAPLSLYVRGVSFQKNDHCVFSPLDSICQ